MMVEPIWRMGPIAKGNFARAVEKANAFEDLRADYQRLILDAEVNLERLIAERREPART
jgi:hypothetical protein